MKKFGISQILPVTAVRAFRWMSLALAFALSGALAQAQNVTFGSATFTKSVDVAETPLNLNGAGIRYRFGFKVYAAGLYLQTKASTTEAALSASGPKRIHLIMLREVEGNELGKLFVRGIEKNTPKGEDLSKIVPGTARMGDAFAQVFAGGKKLLVGDVLHLDYSPSGGTVITLNGKPVGESIKEPQFYVALMRLWLGQDPADRQLKEAMLGQAAPAPAKAAI